MNFQDTLLDTNTTITNAQNVWQNCLDIIQTQTNPQSFKTWFQPIKPIRLIDNVLVIEVPNDFFYEWLEQHYVQLLRKVIRKEIGNAAKLEYQIPIPKNTNTVSKLLNSINTVTSESSSNIIRNPFAIPGLIKHKIDSQINPNYTFANFVEGDCNQLARSAAMSIANKPCSLAYNPLFIYSNSGLGKTHLLQAIGNDILLNYAIKNVLYVSSDKFTTQFTDAIRSNSSNDFVNFYQQIDVLIIDDVQFFAGKQKTQDMFFHIFNHLHQCGKQLILSSDKPPSQVNGIEERLLSRFKWGLTVDIGIPDFETKMAILENKIASENMDIPYEVIEFLANNIHNNIRELHGALVSLMAKSIFSRRSIDITLAKDTIKHIIVYSQKQISMDYITEVVCKYFKLSKEQLHLKTRKQEIAQARQICMYLFRQKTNHSLKEIGRFFNGKDHTTVMHAYHKIANAITKEEKTRQDIHLIRQKLYSDL